LPLEEILQYAQTRTSGQRLKGGHEQKKTGHILDPAGAKTVRSLSSEGQLMAIFQSFPDDLIVLECVLTWCRPCKKMVPVFEKIAAAYPAAHFYKLTGNESEATKFLFKEQLKARVTPSFFFFRGGELVTSCTGANPTRFEDTLRSALRDSERPETRLYEVPKDESEGTLSPSPVASS
jgi:thiol-disulfide isomerase/thioredoxin